MPDEFTTDPSGFSESIPVDSTATEPTDANPSAEAVVEPPPEPTEAQVTTPAVQPALNRPAYQAPAEPILPTVADYTLHNVAPEKLAHLQTLFDNDQISAILSLVNDAQKDAVKTITESLPNVARTVAQGVIQTAAQEQRMAAELGIPTEYLADVEAYSPRIGPQMTDPKARAEAAVLMAMHERAQAEGKSVLDEMQRFVNTARPAPVVTAPVVKPTIKPLSAEAQPTRSAASGGPVVESAKPASNGGFLAALAGKD